MKYIRVRWKHTFPDEPVWLYSELDDERRELRKAEIYADDRIGKADSEKSSGSTQLSNTQVPSLHEINADPQFEAVEIGFGEFEDAWNHSPSPKPKISRS